MRYLVTLLLSTSVVAAVPVITSQPQHPTILLAVLLVQAIPLLILKIWEILE